MRYLSTRDFLLRRSLGLAALLLAACLSPAACCADDTVAVDQGLVQLVQRLSSDAFLQRESAVAALLKSGRPAVGAIRQELDREDPEAAARAVEVLRLIATSEDMAAEEAATQLLTDLSTGESPAAKQARVEIASLARERVQRALNRLEKAGMVASTSPQLNGNSVVYGVRFDESWRGSIEDLSQLQWLQQVTQVQILHPDADDRWMKIVGKLPELSYLSIKRTKITDAGVKMLRQRQPLQELEFMYVGITDASGEHLATINSISKVRLFGTKVTVEGAAELQATLTLADVDRRDGGFLGVGCDEHELGCEITMVSPGTAADRCGIRVGDVVVKYDGHSVADFERLTKWISHNKAGDVVPIVYVRNAEVYNFKLGKIAGKRAGLEVKPHQLGLQVAKVADTSPLLSVLREDDVVFRLNDTRVATLKELDDAIAKLGPDEEATVSIAREFNIFERKAKLGEWE